MKYYYEVKSIEEKKMNAVLIKEFIEYFGIFRTLGMEVLIKILEETFHYKREIIFIVWKFLYQKNKKMILGKLNPKNLKIINKFIIESINLQGIVNRIMN